MNFVPDAVVRIYSAPIDDISDGVRAVEVGVVPIDADQEALPPYEMRAGDNTVHTMTQFINIMRANESLALVRNGWHADTWDYKNPELLVASTYHHPEGGYMFRLQSAEQFEIEADAAGERRDIAHSIITSVAAVRIQFGQFTEYCRAEFGVELMNNDPNPDGGMGMYE